MEDAEELPIEGFVCPARIPQQISRLATAVKEDIPHKEQVVFGPIIAVFRLFS